jgi:hypothetical protein
VIVAPREREVDAASLQRLQQGLVPAEESDSLVVSADTFERACQRAQRAMTV